MEGYENYTYEDGSKYMGMFENGQKKLKKKEVVDILMEQTGVGKTVCYDALKPDGKFGEYLNEDANFLTWIGSDS